MLIVFLPVFPVEGAPGKRARSSRAAALAELADDVNREDAGLGNDVSYGGDSNDGDAGGKYILRQHLVATGR